MFEVVQVCLFEVVQVCLSCSSLQRQMAACRNYNVCPCGKTKDLTFFYKMPSQMDIAPWCFLKAGGMRLEDLIRLKTYFWQG